MTSTVHTESISIAVMDSVGKVVMEWVIETKILLRPDVDRTVSVQAGIG